MGLRKTALFILFIAGASSEAAAQGFTRYSYHDPEKKNLKDVYQVKDTIHNILHGKYISYFLNGKVESKGQFTNNETTGVWEFYFETGALKMRGILFKGANYGLWEYFYENGRKSMEGILYGRNREGEWKSYYENGLVKEIGEYKDNKRTGVWKSYFEDGVIKGSVDYEEDFGTYIEFYHSGKVYAEGPRNGIKNVGHWRYFSEDGTLQSEGDYSNGKKHGTWTTYFPSGKISSTGSYDNDQPTGLWVNMFEDGKVSSSGSFAEGRKDGYWKTFDPTGTLKSEINFEKGSGEYREFYSGGKLKVKGRVEEGKRHGKWEFYFENGVREGYCDYIKDKGVYRGYYPDGNLNTKGTLEGELKTGTWEIYNPDGKLSGYYKPFYENNKLAGEITSLASKPSSRKVAAKGKRSHFDARNNEFKGVIAGSNPLWLAAGRIPVGIEFYLQERLGHEFEFIGIRNPFFKADLDIAAGKKFERGYSVAIKQKLYNPLRAGMWYFGHEIRFTNLGHFVNERPDMSRPDNIFTFNAVEQRVQWGPMIGYRIMRKNNSTGFTLDCFISADIGYRSFDVAPGRESYFDDLNQSKFATTFNFGLNLGHVFSFP
jgi:uncharacterized protein